ncbi:MAG: hypothetical protein JO102_03830, partial [Elusimicrobia bacterium]|nr:hypothetical protein [Elusimicrobiota bacterium]
METSLPQSIDEYWQVFVKRKFHFLIPFTVTAVLIGAAYPFVPKFYKATASIMVDDDQIVSLKNDGRRNNKGSDLDKRLRSVYIEMMEPENIQELATLMDLPASQTKDEKSLRRWGAWMRRGMEVNMQPGGVIDISFSHRDPYWAQKSANSLAQLMVWLDKKSRIEDSQKSIKFIEEQLHLYKS